MNWFNKSNIMRNHIIPKQMTRVGEELSNIFFESPRDFRQWADDNFTNVNEGDYFPTPNWRPNTLYLTLKQGRMHIATNFGMIMKNGWIPAELIYIKYNPVYGKFDELEEYCQYHVDVLVFRAKFSQGLRPSIFPVRSDDISVHVEKRGLRNQDMPGETSFPYHYWTDMRAKSLFGDVLANAPIYEIPFDLGTNCLNFPKGFK